MKSYTLRPDTVTHTELEFHLIFSSGTVCKIITRTTRCARSNSATRARNAEYRLCPVEVNCKGATGKYVLFPPVCSSIVSIVPS